MGYLYLKDVYYLISKEDRRKTDKVARIIELDLDSVYRFNSLGNYSEADYISLIHISNIRLVGNVPKLENEIYKYLAIYCRKIILGTIYLFTLTTICSISAISKKATSKLGNRLFILGLC